MGSPRRHPLLVPALLCAVVVLWARPTTADGDAGGAGGGEPEAGAQVARLYQDAAVATRQYEEGRREARVREAEMRRLDGLLERERSESAVLRADLGRIARAQYRQGGGLPFAAQLLFADSPEDLMSEQHTLLRANLAVEHAVSRSRRAESRLAADESRAASQWQALERRNAQLDTVKRTIQAKLDQARVTLQGQADASAAAGACRGAVRLDQPASELSELRTTGRAWVAPVESYELSAGFGSGGERWAHRHTGQDFAVPIGTPVRAVGAGTVVKVSCGGAFGMEVVVEHPGGYYTQYAHLATVAVDQGERVAPGQWIAQSGTTGNSTGPHLHFEVRVTPELGSAVDPVPWLEERGVVVNLGGGVEP